MSRTEDFLELERRVKRLEKKKAEAEGVLKMLETKLLDKTKTETVEQARQKIEKRRTLVDRKRKGYDNSMEKFKEKWGEKLEG